MLKLVMMLVACVCFNTVQALEKRNFTKELEEIEAELLTDLTVSREKLESIGKSSDKLSLEEKNYYQLLNAHILYMTNNVESAQATLEELNTKSLTTKQKARKLIILSSIYHHKGDSVDAFVALDKSLNLIDALNDQNFKSKVLINAVGIYKDSDLLEFALEYGRRAITIANKMKDTVAMCRASYELGAIELLTKNYKMAENRLLTAKSYCKNNSDVIVGYATDYSLLELNIETNNIQKAESIIKDFYPKVEDYGWDVLRSATSTLYGRLLIEKKELELAKEYGEKAYKLAKNVNDKKRIENAAALLAQIYSQLGDNEKAVQYYQEYMELNVENKIRVRQRKLAFDIARRGKL